MVVSWLVHGQLIPKAFHILCSGQFSDRDFFIKGQHMPINLVFGHFYLYKGNFLTLLYMHHLLSNSYIQSINSVRIIRHCYQ